LLSRKKSWTAGISNSEVKVIWNMLEITGECIRI
jgi:hypothetical protein